MVHRPSVIIMGNNSNSYHNNNNNCKNNHRDYWRNNRLALRLDTVYDIGAQIVTMISPTVHRRNLENCSKDRQTIQSLIQYLTSFDCNRRHRVNSHPSQIYSSSNLNNQHRHRIAAIEKGVIMKTKCRDKIATNVINGTKLTFVLSLIVLTTFVGHVCRATSDFSPTGGQRNIDLYDNRDSQQVKVTDEEEGPTSTPSVAGEIGGPVNSHTLIDHNGFTQSLYKPSNHQLTIQDHHQSNSPLSKASKLTFPGPTQMTLAGHHDHSSTYSSTHSGSSTHTYRRKSRKSNRRRQNSGTQKLSHSVFGWTIDPPKNCTTIGMTVCDSVPSYPSNEIFQVVKSAKRGSPSFNISTFFSDESSNAIEPFSLFDSRPLRIRPQRPLKRRVTSGILVYSTEVQFSERKHRTTSPPTYSRPKKYTKATRSSYSTKTTTDPRDHSDNAHATPDTSLHFEEHEPPADSEIDFDTRDDNRAQVTHNHRHLNMSLHRAIRQTTTSDDNNEDTDRIAVNVGESRSTSNGQSSGSSSSPTSELVIPLCKVRSIYITPRVALTDKRQWKYVVNTPELDPQIKQIVRVDICQEPLDSCSEQVSLPFGFTSQCKQKYAKKKLLAINGDRDQLEVDTFFIPSCCVCQIIRDNSLDITKSR